MFDQLGFGVADYTASKSFFSHGGGTARCGHGDGGRARSWHWIEGQAVALAVPDCRKAAADAHRVRGGEAPAG